MSSKFTIQLSQHPSELQLDLSMLDRNKFPQVCRFGRGIQSKILEFDDKLIRR